MEQELILTRGDYERFRDLVLDRSGLYFPEEKRQSLERGLAESLAGSAYSDLDKYYEVLQSSYSSHREWARVVSSLTVGETYFFRNKGHIDALTSQLLPELIARRRQTGRSLRIWSAGCATGEEPYSVAMILRELIPDLDAWNIHILATDINRDSLRQAQAGLYSSWSFRGVDKSIRERYFSPNGDKRWAIADEIKQMVTFDYLNLVGDPYPSVTNNTGAMDVVFCRNVTIYFSPEVTQMVMNRLYGCLVDGGWLIPGASEPNMLFYNAFQQCSFPRATIYRKPVEASTNVQPILTSKPVLAKPSGPAVMATPGPHLHAKAPPAALPDDGPAISHAAPDSYDTALGLVQSGRLDEAIAILRVKIGRDPHFHPAYYLMGKIYANQGNLKEAQQWCEKAVETNKLRSEPYLILSMIYQQRGLPARAIDALRKSIYLDREFVLAHYGLAQLHKRQGNDAQARKSLQNAQRLLSNRPKLEPVREGDGMVAGTLLQLVETELTAGNETRSSGGLEITRSLMDHATPRTSSVRNLGRR